MNERHFKIDTYQYQLYSSATSGTRGKILLYSENTVVAIVNLVDVPGELPHSYRKPTGQFILYYKIS
ncbi:MAG: hypothetical protein QW728_01830, partial [Thermoplasmata archaeon]